MRHTCAKRSKCRERALLFTHKTKAIERDQVITTKRVKIQVNARKKARKYVTRTPPKSDKYQDSPFRSFKGIGLGQHSKTRVLC